MGNLARPLVADVNVLIVAAGALLFLIGIGALAWMLGLIDLDTL